MAARAAVAAAAATAAGVVGEHGQRVRQGVLVLPQLEALHRADAAHVAKGVGPPLAVGPHHIHVEAVHQVLLSEVALEGYGRVEGGEFICEVRARARLVSLLSAFFFFSRAVNGMWRRKL